MSEWSYSVDDALSPSEAMREMLVALEGGGWGVIGASVGGVRREAVPAEDGREGREVQDACAAAVSMHGALVTVVADGAGSARLGGLGARVAATAALRLMTTSVHWSPGLGRLPFESVDEWRESAFRLMRCVRCVVLRAAREARAHRDDVACTLTVVYANPVVVLSAQLGDARAAVMWDDGAWEAITTPQRGEHAGETQFLTSSSWRRTPGAIDARMQIGRVEAIALLTDGGERVAFECQSFDQDSGRFDPANRPHVPFLTPNVRTLQRMLRNARGHRVMEVARMWGHFLREGTPELPALRDEPDDKTLLLAVRHEVAALPAVELPGAMPSAER